MQPLATALNPHVDALRRGTITRLEGDAPFHKCPLPIIPFLQLALQRLVFSSGSQSAYMRLSTPAHPAFPFTYLP
jgi:hypothetical protein